MELFIFLLLIIKEIIFSILNLPWYKTEIPISNVATMKKPFAPVRWGVGPYIQTLLNITLDMFEKRSYQREYHQLTDGTTIALDCKSTENMSDTTPILFVCHGLGGSSNNPFIHALTDKLAQYRTIVYNRRGHGGMDNKGKLPRHVDIADMKEVVTAVRNKYPKAPLLGIGISAGANLLVCYAGQEKNHPFRLLVSISNGHNLLGVANNMSWVFNRILTNYLKRLIKPRHKLQNINELKDFDTHVTVPWYNYNSVEEYYDKCSSYKWFDSITVPLLSISALDDPLISDDLQYYPIEAAMKNPNITAVLTRKGGHVGWVDRIGHSWCIDRVEEFIKNKGF